MNNINDWEKWYKEQVHIYEQFTTKLHVLIEELLADIGIKGTIESRTKSVNSFLEKINRPNKKYLNPDEITDLSGIRVILRTKNDVEKISEMLDREFLIDRKNSVNKLDQLNLNEFGYVSQHYVISLKNPRSNLPEWKTMTKCRAEIQVRTILQHAWATIAHSLYYKNEIDIPDELKRKFFRLSALFEIADDELDDIVKKGEAIFERYKNRIKEKDRYIELNVDSLRAYIETSNNIREWAKFIESLGVRVGPVGAISRDVKMAKLAGINSIADLDIMLEKSKKWGHKYLKEFYERTFGKPDPTKHSSDINGIITLFLIANFPDIFTDEILKKEFGFGMPERATIPAKKLFDKGELS